MKTRFFRHNNLKQHFKFSKRDNWINVIAIKTYITNKLLEFNQVIKILVVLLIFLCNLEGLNAQTTIYSHTFDDLTGFSTSNGSFGTMSGCSSSNNFYGINEGITCVSGFSGGTFYTRDLNASSAGSVSSATVTFPTSSVSSDGEITFTAKFGYDQCEYSGANTVTFQYKFASSDGWTTGCVMSGYNKGYGSTDDKVNCTDCGIVGDLTAETAETISFSMGSGHSGTTLYMQFVISGFGGASENFVLDDVSVTAARSPLTFYVNDNSTSGDTWCAAVGDDANDGTSVSTPKATLSAALALATTSGDVIRVDKGTYNEENLSIPDGSGTLTINGAGKTLTIFDGDNTDDWLTIASGGNTSNITITDMTVKEYGGTASQSGGAVRHLGGTGIVFQDMIFESNRAYYSTNGGGVIYIDNAAAVEFDRCIMRSNWSDYRGSVVLHEGSGALTMKNCLIYENDSDNGSDIYIGNGSPTVNLYNITVADNTGSYSYGAVSCWTGTCNAYNSIFYNNESTYDVWDNSGTMTTYYCMFDAADGTTNNEVSGSPTFASSINDDYRLKYGSTGVNAGDNTHVSGISYDLNGDTRTQNTTVDLGCYEWSCTTPDGGTVLSSGTVCSNTTTSMTVYSYEAQYFKWQTSDDNSFWSDISSTDANSYTTPALTSTTYYRTAASCDNSTWAYSSSVTQTVNHITYYVNDNSTSGDIFCSAVGNDANNGTSVSTPKLTLGAALALATCGDTIKIDAGTYTEENITIADDTDEIYIMGLSSALTIFDSDNTDDWITFSPGGNTSGITITDLTVKEYGGSANQHGGALRILGGTSILFEDVIFTGNQTANGSSYGAVAYIENAASVDFSRCNINNNISPGRASVYYDASSGDVNMYNCLIVENDANAYGDFYSNDGGGTSTITNCTFADNGAQSSGIGASGEVWSIFDGTFTFNNCIFYNNATGYDINENFESVTLNYCMYDAVSSNSLVANNTVSGTPTFTDAAGDDYTLTSGSTGVDAGNDSYVSGISLDLAGNTRDVSTVDLGAYEYNPINWTGTTSTAWATSTNWDTGVVPSSGQSPVIPDVSGASNNFPVITSAVSLGSITVNSNASITISSNSLTVTGAIDCDGTMNIDNATVNADGDADFTNGTIDFTHASGKLIASSTVTSLGTLDVASGTVEYDGADAQTIFADTYYNLELDGDGSGAKSAGGTITVNGALTVGSNAEKLNLGANTITVTGATDIDSELDFDNASSVFDANGTFDATGATITFTNSSARLQLASTVTSLGTLDASGGTVEYDGSTQNVLADAYYNLEIDQAGTKTAQGTITAAGTMTVQSAATYAIAATTTTVTGATDLNGTLTCSTGTYNADGDFDATSGTIDFTDAGKLILSSSVTDLGTLDNASGTVEYDGGTQTVFGDNYYSLEIDAAGTKTAGGNLDIDGNLTTSATAGCKLDMGANNLNIAGNMNVGATDGSDFSDASCTVTFDGSSNQSITHAGNTGSAGATLYTNACSSTAGTVNELRFSASSSAACNGTSYYANVYSTYPTAWVYDYVGSADGGQYTIQFDYKVVDYHTAAATSSSDFTFVVDYSTNGSSWSTVHTVSHTESASCATYSFNHTPSSGNCYYRWYVTWIGDDFNVHIDDISITAAALPGTEFTNIEINKSGGDVDLSSAIDIDGTLTLTAGYLDASDNAVTFADGGTTSGASAASHIKGKINKNTTSTSAFTFPIGDGTEYEPLTITPNSTSANTWQLTYSVSDHGDRNMGTGMDHVSWKEYWDLSRTSGSDGVTIAFNWDSDDGVTDYANLTVGHFTGGNWEVVASTPSGNNTSGTLTTDAAVTSFSPFTKGSTVAANVLPVSLLSLEAECKEDYTELNWVTASEINNDYFMLERSDKDGLFDYIGEVEGYGTTSNMSQYSYKDYQYEGGLAYYRLTQYDFDGESEVLQGISVNCQDELSESASLSLSSNKINGSIQVISEVEENQFYDLIIYDATGKKVYSGQGFTESGQINDKVFIHTQATGVYIVQLVVEDKMISEKLIW